MQNSHLNTREGSHNQTSVGFAMHYTLTHSRTHTRKHKTQSKPAKRNLTGREGLVIKCKVGCIYRNIGQN